MATFYHVSPTPIRVGEYIEPRKEAAQWRKEECGVETYACLAPNYENAVFWVRSLEWSFRYRVEGEKKKHDVWFIHTVEIEDREAVELCIDGVYYNFNNGIVGTAAEIEYLADDVPTDSEVVVTKPIAKVVAVELFTIPSEWWND